MGVGFEIAIIVVLIIANGLFSMSEIAVVSSRKARLQQAADSGSAGARSALALSDNPGRFLSTVQVGISLIGVLSGAFGGATLASRLAPVIEPIPVIGGSAQPVAFVIVVILITYATLILGELVPKRIGLSNPERVAAQIAPPMTALARVTSPAITLLERSTQLVLRLVPGGDAEEPPVTESEIAVLLDQGTEAGVFVAAERDLIGRVFELGDRRAINLMTPRSEVTWLDLEDPFETNRDLILSSHRSIFPVAMASLDDLRGVVRAKDILADLQRGTSHELEKHIRPVEFVPEGLPALRLLETFKRASDPMAIVVDEYGGTQGIVTLHDVLEEIVGDIGEEHHAEDPDAVEREDGSWLIDGMVPVDGFLSLLGLPPLPDEEDGNYNTLGGFVLTRTGRIPDAGDLFDWQGWRFEVMDMDGNRVDKVLASPIVDEPDPLAGPADEVTADITTDAPGRS
ncbi:MAG TPA: hemolysin family protein [Thermomicrobiales bacterium]|nr:hemolysin family protein [Thermomicrobiales bacterium]